MCVCQVWSVGSPCKTLWNKDTALARACSPTYTTWSQVDQFPSLSHFPHIGTMRIRTVKLTSKGCQEDEMRQWDNYVNFPARTILGGTLNYASIFEIIVIITYFFSQMETRFFVIIKTIHLHCRTAGKKSITILYLNKIILYTVW